MHSVIFASPLPVSGGGTGTTTVVFGKFLLATPASITQGSSSNLGWTTITGATTNGLTLTTTTVAGDTINIAQPGTYKFTVALNYQYNGVAAGVAVPVTSGCAITATITGGSDASIPQNASDSGIEGSTAHLVTFPFTQTFSTSGTIIFNLAISNNGASAAAFTLARCFVAIERVGI